MKKSEKKWSFFIIVNLIAVLSCALLTNYCQNSMQESQKAVPPPPPDDYIGVLIYFMLSGLTWIFGFLFVVSLLVLGILFIKNKIPAQK